MARNWLSGIAAGDVDAVTKATAVPFDYATTAKRKRCEGALANAADIDRWLNCLRKDRVLMHEIREGELATSPRATESRALRKLASRIAASGEWVEAFINGDGVTYTFRFLLHGGLVRAFLVDAEFETG